ncbi:hypothetical protein [Nocardioides sp.]|uniref:hypothetical protein n=1 Tax=Nocardioides sp. TaxID=35761 RepID=UPI0039E7152B
MGLVVRVVVVLLLLAGGIAAGWTAGRTEQSPVAEVAEATPLEATPALPYDPQVPYADDIDFPTLQPGLAYESHTIGTPDNLWSYQVPKRWTSPDEDDEDALQIRWQPPGQPVFGGYSLRLMVVNDNRTPKLMKQHKIIDLENSPDILDFEIVSQTDDTVAFRYRTSVGNVLRFNTFRWFAGPDGLARIEMSVVGRERDVPGLDDLLAKVSASIRPADQMP